MSVESTAINPHECFSRQQLEPYRQMVRDFSATRFAYAELLLRWGLHIQAADIVQLAIEDDDGSHVTSQSANGFVIGMWCLYNQQLSLNPEFQPDVRQRCSTCLEDTVEDGSGKCERCRSIHSRPSCSVCRLPVKGKYSCVWYSSGD